jgi:hypothetical protein
MSVQNTNSATNSTVDARLFSAASNAKSADERRDEYQNCHYNNVQPVYLAQIDRHETSPLARWSLAQTRDAGHPRLL